MNKQIMGLGWFRFMLACFVAVSHLFEYMIHGPAAYAVWGFYLLSGFLMSLILTNKYKFNTIGIKAYIYNRFIRIYPAYWTAVVFGIIVLVFLKSEIIVSQKFNPQFDMPHGIVHWLHVLTALPFVSSGYLPVATSHALSLEIGMYLLAPLICRSKATALLCFVIGFLVNFNLGFNTASFADRYSTFLPTLMAFSAGSLLFYYKTELNSLKMPFLSLIAWFAYCLIWLWKPSWPWTYGLYVSLFLSGWVVLSLYEFKSSSDDFVGDLSYPIYLLHTAVAALAGVLFDLETKSLPFCIVGLIATLIISCVVSKYVERPIRRMKIK